MLDKALTKAILDDNHYSQARAEAARVRRLLQRIRREAAFGEHVHRLTRDEETYVAVGLNLLQRTLDGRA